jgi:hypothetical protein
VAAVSPYLPWRGRHETISRRDPGEPALDHADLDHAQGSATDPTAARLVAVDLGLRTGIAVFDGTGAVRSVTSRNLGRRSRLRGAARAVVGEQDRLDVLVVEGDRGLAAAWERQAAPRGARCLQVTPEVWRARLLHPRERRDGRAAKAAADPLARTAIATLGGQRVTSLRHDAAEAVLIGVWGLLEVGWLDTLPPALDPRRR